MAINTVALSTPAGSATVFSTGLNSLADGASVSTATDLDLNAAGRPRYADFTLSLASVNLSGSTNPAAYLYLKYKKNAVLEAATGEPARQPDKIFQLNEISGTQVWSVRVWLEGQDEVEVELHNKSGATWAASGNTLEVEYSTDEIETP